MRVHTLGLDEDEAARLGLDRATRIRTFRLIVLLAQELQTVRLHSEYNEMAPPMGNVMGIMLMYIDP